MQAGKKPRSNRPLPDQPLDRWQLAAHKELEIEDDQDGEEVEEEDEEDEEEEDCQSEKSATAADQHERFPAVDAVSAKTDEPRTTTTMKTHRVNVARLSQVSEEEERLTGYLIEAQALELEPHNWRETLNNEGPVESRIKFYKALDTNLEDRKRKIDRLQHLIMEFGEPYLNYTWVNEVMIRADEAIWKTLVERQEKCMLAKAHAVHGSGYHSMRFVLPEKFGKKSYIDVDRPLSRLQRCTDKNRPSDPDRDGEAVSHDYNLGEV